MFICFTIRARYGNAVRCERETPEIMTQKKRPEDCLELVKNADR